MLRKNLDWLPLVCEKVIDGEYSDQQLIRLSRDCRLEITQLRTQRSRQHRTWMGLRLSRGEHETAMRIIDWSEAELEYLGLAVKHIRKWEERRQDVDLKQARTRLQMADQAHRQYLKNRVTFEPCLMERMAA